MQDILLTSLEKLDKWIIKNGWAGYDPYDIKGHSFFIKIQSNEKNLYNRFLRLIFFYGESLFPLLYRRIFRIKKSINAKAMGLFAESYLNLYIKLKDEKYLHKTKECLEWLIDNKSPEYKNYCWGYPFDWQSRIFIPRNTPSAIVSTVCGQAFWAYYQYTKENQYLEICKSICNFLVNNLNQDIISNDKICFSYTPLDNFHIHNANLFVAEFLIKIGKEINNQEYYRLGQKALNYTLSQQNKDGSFFYWGKPDKLLYKIDHYHTGFVLRSLFSIYQLTGDKKLYQHLKNGLNFYINNLFYHNTTPKIESQKLYPINIHSCAEAILSLSVLSTEFPRVKALLKNTTYWIISDMQDKKGYFYYMKLPYKTIKIPYIRWGQAWMINSLSHSLSKQN